MTLGELINKFTTCRACISIQGLCDEYRDGIDFLKCEDWYKNASKRRIKNIAIIGFEETSCELCIDLEN